jgi:hypothetical protein
MSSLEDALNIETLGMPGVVFTHTLDGQRFRLGYIRFWV